MHVQGKNIVRAAFSTIVASGIPWGSWNVFLQISGATVFLRVFPPTPTIKGFNVQNKRFRLDT